MDRRFESIDRWLDDLDLRLSTEFSNVHERIDRLFIVQVAGIVAIVVAILAQTAIF